MIQHDSDLWLAAQHERQQQYEAERTAFEHKAGHPIKRNNK
jgi:hypothetical protein